MLKSFSVENRKAFFDLVSLIIVIYCAAILGDYVTEAIVIKYLTVKALPNLFQLNALCLFGISFILFQFIDRLHRASVIWMLSGFFSVVVVVFGILVRHYAWASVILYATAYISKLSLFVVFWIIANDICDTRQSKQIFPMLAGAGLLGGLLSSLISSKIIYLISVEDLLWPWAFLLVLPSYFVLRLRKRYDAYLQAPEPGLYRPLLQEFSEVMGERAVLLMAAVYFLVFLLIFNLDYLFTRALSERFQISGRFNAEGFVTFRFNVFLVATSFIIAFQFIYAGNLSRRFGVTNLLLMLPITFAIGFIILTGLSLKESGAILTVFFAFILIFYVFRQFLFECLFSANYQVFFSAFSRKFRGKGKLLLEGFVKPLGIAFAGGVILFLSDRPMHYAFLAFCSLLLIVFIFLLRKEYSHILLREDVTLGKNDIMRLIKNEMSGKNQRKILSLITKALQSRDFDLKRMLIKYLEFSGSPAAFALLRQRFFEETDRIREIIANSLSTFDTLEARGFLRKLLEDPNAAIRAGVLRSIRRNPVIRPKNFTLSTLIFDTHPSVFKEAVCMTYVELTSEEKIFVHEKVRAFFESERLDERVAAIQVIGTLKLQPFFERLVALIHSHSFDTWKAAVQAVLLFGEQRAIDALIQTLESSIDRSRENFIIDVLGGAHEDFYPFIEERLLLTQRKRTAFSLIKVMRLMASRYLQINRRPISQRPEVRVRLIEMAMHEVRVIYADVYHYYHLRVALFREVKKVDLLRDALRERRARFSRFILDMLSIIEESGTLLFIEPNFRLLTDREKANVIELIETFGDKSIRHFLVPILEEYDERELLKIGSSKWKQEGGSGAKALTHFKESGSQWIRSIALFLEERVLKHAA